jgi:hypothetical protein
MEKRAILKKIIPLPDDWPSMSPIEKEMKNLSLCVGCGFPLSTEDN